MGVYYEAKTHNPFRSSIFIEWVFISLLYYFLLKHRKKITEEEVKE